MTFAEVFDKFVSKNIGGDVSSHRLVSCSISGSDGQSHTVDNFHDTPMAVVATFLCTSVKFSISGGTPATNVTSAFDTMMEASKASFKRNCLPENTPGPAAQLSLLMNGFTTILLMKLTGEV